MSFAPDLGHSPLNKYKSALTNGGSMISHILPARAASVISKAVNNNKFNPLVRADKLTPAGGYE
jgi:hypothetical protein